MMDREELLFAGIARQAELIRAGEVTSTELVSASLERIAELDPLLNAFRSVMGDEAMEAAAAADSAGSGGVDRPLHGVPIAIKNDTDVAGQPTSVGSRATSKTAKTEDAEVVRRLRDAGAIIVGTTNVPELTVWPFTETEAFGFTRNPWNTEHTPGGSSGGTAAAVAAGMVGAALGSDGGGSIRIPAACCGLFGIKPQRGRVPIAPKLDAWHGLSVLGPLARRVIDAALFLDVASASDGQYAAAAATKPGRLRVGYSATPPLPGPVGAEQKRAMQQAAGLLERLGHSTAEVKPDYATAIPAFLPRYLRGIADDAAKTEQPELLDSRTKGMARAGRLVPDALLAKAMNYEPKASAKLNAIFNDIDIFITPGLAAQPLPVGKFRGRGALWTFNGVARFTPYCAPWNMTGQPAVTVPVGFDADGLPLTVQIVGPADSEELLISVAAQIEAERPWADARPKLPA